MSDPAPPRVLIGGIGNLFFGDDAFGVEVARALAQRPWPAGVQVVDFGIRNYDLAYALAAGPGLAILVDAVPRGEPPGTLYLLELDFDAIAALDQGAGNAHSAGVVQALQMALALGGRPGRLLLLGCEPGRSRPGEEEDFRFGLSEPVRLAVPRAADRVEALIAEFLHSDHREEPGLVNAGNESHYL